jgi:hypothetical protein
MEAKRRAVVLRALLHLILGLLNLTTISRHGRGRRVWVITFYFLLFFTFDQLSSLACIVLPLLSVSFSPPFNIQRSAHHRPVLPLLCFHLDLEEIVITLHQEKPQVLMNII